MFYLTKIHKTPMVNDPYPATHSSPGYPGLPAAAEQGETRAREEDLLEHAGKLRETTACARVDNNRGASNYL